MKKLILFTTITLAFLFIQTSLESKSALPNNDIAAIVNGEEISIKEFKRLYNSQIKKLYSNLNFDLFSLADPSSEISKERNAYLDKAEEENIVIRPGDLDNELNLLIESLGSIENLINKANEKKIPVPEIKNKLNENLILSKYFEKNISKKIMDQLINEVLILQEAKSRDITSSDEETRKRLDTLIEREGGILSFIDFLKNNNATVQDAENEIKKQIVFELVSNELSKDNANNLSLKDLIAERKLNANIVIYTNKLFENQAAEDKEEPAITPSEVSLRNNAYPTLTRTKAEEIKKIEENTNEILNHASLSESPELREPIPVIRGSDYDIKEFEANMEEFEKKYIKKKIRFPHLSFKKRLREEDVPLLNEAQIKEAESRINFKQDIQIEEIK